MKAKERARVEIEALTEVIAELQQELAEAQRELDQWRTQYPEAA